MRIVIVGGGRQGVVIASNLLARPEKPAVVICDLFEPTGMPRGATFKRFDVLQAGEVADALKGADAAVLAVPSSIAHDALNNILVTGVPVVDVSFTPDPPLSLDHVAKKSGSCCVVDCGVAPGLSHILMGAAHSELGGLDWAKIWVGGMPQSPPPVFKHAIYFNPHDLLAEYVRPARARTAGKDVSPNPMKAPVETMKDSELGELEAFISDGLRSLLGSYPDVTEMSELTLRWPGHLETMRNLAELGLLDAPKACEEMAKVLATKFDGETYPDVLLLIVETAKGDKKRTWRMIDRRTDNQSAMARTTGFTTAAVAMLLAKRQFTEPGVHPPERLGKETGLAKLIVEDLVARGIKITEVPQASLAQCK